MTKQKPRERLEKTLARVAREQGLDQERLRRWVSFLALCGALDRAIAPGILSGYYLKGGVAMVVTMGKKGIEDAKVVDDSWSARGPGRAVNACLNEKAAQAWKPDPAAVKPGQYVVQLTFRPT